MGDDDDEDKPPSLRVVSDNPNARIDRQAVWAKEEVERALSEFVAALLRTMAGSDREAVYLMRRLSNFVDTLNKLREESGRGLTAAELQAMLRLPGAESDFSDDDWRHRRWLREHGMEVIVKGALRLAAHKILGEEPHFGGKYSEVVIEDGIKTLEELKRPSPAPQSPRKKGLAQSWDDVDFGPSKPEEPKRIFGERLGRAAPRGRKPDRGFSQQDLKELRKAIKANDKKRIAELTAKINKPPFND
jgi:hypothetical protein